MERELMGDPTSWKESPNRKPLLLYGARQAGKTCLLGEFERCEYEGFVRVDFLKEASLRVTFQRDLDVGRIVREIALRKNSASILQACCSSSTRYRKRLGRSPR